ncbi:MAG TPA: peptide-methionine (R)-S-oxide reductase MsrB [Planctomycetaceae bacterium]|nr:peptide-methionine (R)-S-oxide reductase MsrB [Planctomycetaceae bacterium]
MLQRRLVFVALPCVALLAWSLAAAAPPKSTGKKKRSEAESKSAETDKDDETANDDAADEHKKVIKTDAEWRKILTPNQFRVTRKKETEPAGTGIYARSKKDGIYKCVCCGQLLFDSKTKFESGTGWPSFYEAIDEKAIQTLKDTSEGLVRLEVQCSRCDAHLGHVFDDGPQPTGLRYCMNSASLKFVSRQALSKDGKPKKDADAKDDKATGAKPKGGKPK